MQDVQISSYQFFILVFFYTIGSSILLIPSTLVSTAHQQGWIAGCVGVMVGVALTFLYVAISKKQKDTPFLHYVENVYGKWGSFIFAVHYVLFFIILTALVLRDMGDFIVTQSLTDTPLIQIQFILMALVVYGTKLGLSTVGRFGEILFPIFLLLFATFFFLVSPEIEFENMLPIWPLKLKDLTKSSIAVIGFPFLELCAFLIIQPYVKRRGNLIKPYVGAVIFGGSLLVSVTLQSILVMSPELTSTFLYPTYELAKHVRIDHFLERIEAIMAILWFISLFFKVALCFWATLKLINTALHLADARYLAVPLAIIILIYSITMSPNVMFIWFSARVWPYYALISGFILPVILLFKKPKEHSI